MDGTKECLKCLPRRKVGVPTEASGLCESYNFKKRRLPFGARCFSDGTLGRRWCHADVILSGMKIVLTVGGVILLLLIAWIIFSRYFYQNSPSIMDGGYDQKMQEKEREHVVSLTQPLVDEENRKQKELVGASAGRYGEPVATLLPSGLWEVRWHFSTSNTDRSDLVLHVDKRSGEVQRIYAGE